MATGPNSARIRDGIEAFNRHDVETLLSLLTEDVQWKRVDGLPDVGGGLIEGREAVRQFLKPHVFDRQRFEPIEMVEGDDKVLVHGVFCARGAASGVELEVETYAVYWLDDDGLARRVESWRSREDAERTSGLRLG